MKRQYIIRKYVMAESAQEAVEKSKRVPIDEVYIDNSWLERNTDNNLFLNDKSNIGFNAKKQANKKTKTSEGS